MCRETEHRPRVVSTTNAFCQLTPQEFVPLHQYSDASRCGCMYTPLPEDCNHETNAGFQVVPKLFGFKN
jgi:hypothetical protein